MDLSARVQRFCTKGDLQASCVCVSQEPKSVPDFSVGKSRQECGIKGTQGMAELVTVL